MKGEAKHPKYVARDDGDKELLGFADQMASTEISCQCATPRCVVEAGSQ
jgi:hypothetical protein